MNGLDIVEACRKSGADFSFPQAPCKPVRCAVSSENGFRCFQRRDYETIRFRLRTDAARQDRIHPAKQKGGRSRLSEIIGFE
ncbi:hypothetical protein, partial [Mesorhizobium sp.]|uniref:hypothetical protein n=1 Tax=Mesorhizobium sp. TaxID=1871066 RepID=UPI0025D05CF1